MDRKKKNLLIKYIYIEYSLYVEVNESKYKKHIYYHNIAKNMHVWK